MKYIRPEVEITKMDDEVVITGMSGGGDLTDDTNTGDTSFEGLL